MSKRSRALYEADLRAQQSPFVAFGTPLPPADPDVRDDGSYVPVWKQEVRDEKGRRRLHGAFTGGWSAGYYNTVGSKEGWTPAPFMSSRTNRHKDNPNAVVHRPEDYMDEEDLADAEEARSIQTSGAFAGLGLTEDELRSGARRGDGSGGGGGGGLAGLFKVQGETMGIKLLKKMGWREGQGIGPKVRRAARLDVGSGTGGGRRPDHGKATYLFAPEDVTYVRLVKKTDRKGLGFAGEARLAALGRPSDKGRAGDDRNEDEDEDEDEGENGEGDGINSITRTLFGRPKLGATNTTGRKSGRTGGIGIGVLNDTGSDDEDDPYDMGPRISFNRTLGGDKKKKKAKQKSAAETTNAATSSSSTGLGLKPKLVFSGKLGRGSTSRVRLCYDGRPPLPGFVWGRVPDALTADVNAARKYPPPTVPPGWTSAKTPQPRAGVAPATASAPPPPTSYLSTADAAKASQLDSRSRAAMLGESPLPGKSVFDFLSADARARIASATGRTDLPEARGEVPAEYALSADQKREQLLRAIPALDKATAVAAITRGARGGGPYQDDEAKRARYRAYLEYHAGLTGAQPPLPSSTGGTGSKVSDDDWLRECHEFANCARIFRPMAGPMASRFTPSSASAATGNPTGTAGTSNNDRTGTGNGKDPARLVSRPAPKPQDPAEEAAKMGMYGPLTRSVQDFFPTRLLCKRLGVPPPAIVQPDTDGMDRTGVGSKSKGIASGFGNATYGTYAPAPAPAGAAASAEAERWPAEGAAEAGLQKPDQPQAQASNDVVVQADRNEALEGKRANEAVFRAVFGDSDEDEDEDGD